MDNEFESYLTARNHYRQYKQVSEDPTIVDETENSPQGIYASIIRFQPGHPSEVEDEDEEAHNSGNETTWDQLETVLNELNQGEF
jgi:hypothetical protein